MRHKVFGKKLGRDYDHRRALLKNLARSFFANNGQLKTTLPKAKAVRGMIEKIITRARKGDLSARRWLFRLFQDQKTVNQVVDTFGKKFAKRQGGYTKLVKLSIRKGDNATIVRLESVEKIEPKEEEKKTDKKTGSKKEVVKKKK